MTYYDHTEAQRKLKMKETYDALKKHLGSLDENKNAIWIVEEQGFKVDSSRVLGIPFATTGLYNPPSSFQINDNYQLLTREIKKSLIEYQCL
jgi:hypothetical protein